MLRDGWRLKLEAEIGENGQRSTSGPHQFREVWVGWGCLFQRGFKGSTASLHTRQQNISFGLTSGVDVEQKCISVQVFSVANPKSEVHSSTASVLERMDETGQGLVLQQLQPFGAATPHVPAAAGAVLLHTRLQSWSPHQGLSLPRRFKGRALTHRRVLVSHREGAHVTGKQVVLSASGRGGKGGEDLQ